MRVNSYTLGRIVINSNECTSGMVVLPDKVIPNWWRREGFSLTYTVTSKGIIIHPTNDTLPHNIIVNENMEIFLPNFHLTSILNLPSKMKI